ncbi:hypothetical protein G6N74_25415 [Mesorhizobium sp. CGMCC 1.15528]|uniref:Uncharacterized protein n=1 Tax=Mesorhizobium zhangyense TaxID=1776730 RepID=A0A7C9RB34_9HYPH|nr:hypothetical protein [Mesorhizobium zhangyense]NGN44416.1 hypothetical protein [Mesorhizobium zhangyense]
MSLPVLVAIVVVGIALCVLAVHLTGGSKGSSITAADDAKRRFGEDFPEEAVWTVRLTADGKTAFLELDGDRTGIVQTFGDKFLTRIITQSDVVSLTSPDPECLSIRLKDFTWAGGDFTFANAADASAVRNVLLPAKREAS